MRSVWLALAAAAFADDRAAAGYPGLAVHQMYAREMLGEPSCRAYVSDPAWAYALNASVGALPRESGPIAVYAGEGGGGLGNVVFGFVTAFAQSLLRGRPLFVRADGVVGKLCEAFACGFPSEGGARDAAATLVLRSHRLPTTEAELPECMLRVTRCWRPDLPRVRSEKFASIEGAGCFAGRAIQLLLAWGLRARARRDVHLLLDTSFVGANRSELLGAAYGGPTARVGRVAVHARTGDYSMMHSGTKARAPREVVEMATLYREICVPTPWLRAENADGSGVFLASDSVALKRYVYENHGARVSLAFFNVTAIHIKHAVDPKEARHVAALHKTEAKLAEASVFIDFFVLSRAVTIVGLPISTYSWAAALLGGRPFHTCSPGGTPNPDRAPGTPSWLEPGPAIEDTLEHLRRADPQSTLAEQAPGT